MIVAQSRTTQTSDHAHNRISTVPRSASNIRAQKANDLQRNRIEHVLVSNDCEQDTHVTWDLQQKEKF